MFGQLADKYKAISLRTKFILAVVLIGCAGYSSYTEFVVPAQEAVESAKQADQQLEQEIANMNKNGPSLAAIEASKKQAEEEFATLLELLPKDVDIDRLLASFADAAKEAGVNLKEFAPVVENSNSIYVPPPPPVSTPLPSASPAPKAASAAGAPVPAPIPVMRSLSDTVRRIPLQTKLEGTYPQLVSFFDKVLSIPRVVRLENFKLISPERPNSNTTIDIQNPNKSKTTTIPSAPSSPTLRVEAQFVAYVQKGTNALSLLNPSTSLQGARAISGAPGKTGPGKPPEAPGMMKGTNEGLSAKPLGTPNGAQ